MPWLTHPNIFPNNLPKYINNIIYRYRWPSGHASPARRHSGPCHPDAGSCLDRPPCRRAKHAHAEKRQPQEVVVTVGVLDATAAGLACGRWGRGQGRGGARSSPYHHVRRGSWTRPQDGRVVRARASHLARRAPVVVGRGEDLAATPQTPPTTVGGQREMWGERRDAALGEVRRETASREREAWGMATALRGGAALGEARARAPRTYSYA